MLGLLQQLAYLDMLSQLPAPHIQYTGLWAKISEESPLRASYWFGTGRFQSYQGKIRFLPRIHEDVQMQSRPPKLLQANLVAWCEYQ